MRTCGNGRRKGLKIPRGDPVRTAALRTKIRSRLHELSLIAELASTWSTALERPCNRALHRFWLVARDLIVARFDLSQPTLLVPG